MSEMIDRVAQALCRATMNSPSGYEPGWVDRRVALNSHLFVANAKVAIAAMRTPTDAMVQAVRRSAPHDRDAAETWPLMIDEALK